jgi:hypothetical protein
MLGDIEETNLEIDIGCNAREMLVPHIINCNPYTHICAKTKGILDKHIHVIVVKVFIC